MADGKSGFPVRRYPRCTTTGLVLRQRLRQPGSERIFGISFSGDFIESCRLKLAFRRVETGTIFIILTFP